MIPFFSQPSSSCQLIHTCPVGLGGCCRNPSLNYITMVIFQSAEYGRTRRDLVRAELILAACTVYNTIFYIPECVYMPIERLSIKRMQDFGAIFPGEHAPGPPYYVHALPFSSRKRKATNKITDKLPVHSFAYNLTILMRRQKRKQGM